MSLAPSLLLTTCDATTRTAHKQAATWSHNHGDTITADKLLARAEANGHKSGEQKPKHDA
jgi:hypothetical protein